jgi:hypothetical protein
MLRPISFYSYAIFLSDLDLGVGSLRPTGSMNAKWESAIITGGCVVHIIFYHASMHKVRPVCSSYLAFAVGIRNLDNYLDLHTGAEWDLRRAKRAAGMRTALAKDFQKKFGGAIGDLVRFGKAGSCSPVPAA